MTAGRIRRGVAVLVAGATAAALSSAPASAQLVTQPSCAGPAAQVRVVSPGGVFVLQWRENLAFDGLGGLWVSNVGWNDREGRLERFAPDGSITATLPLRAPVGVVRAPSGLMYAGGTGPDGNAIYRFDPADVQPKLAKFATGRPGANGMIFDSDGNLYVSKFPEAGITKLRPDGSVDAAWTAQADLDSPNGLVIVGDTLYANQTMDPRSAIERVPLANPGAHAPFTHLSPGGLTGPLVPKGLDDLTVNAAGMHFYTAATTTGELLRVERSTGSACVVASGFTFPTSVRFAHQFGDFSPSRDLFVTDGWGGLRHVRLA